MIDVIIPAYNAEKTLGRCLASLAAQTDGDFRVTVIDDHSDDLTSIRDIAVGFRHLLKDVRCIRLPDNAGPGMARQYGIDNTDGEWITFLDADDVLMPYAIEVFKVIIGSNPDMNMLHSSFYRQHVMEDGGHALEEVRKGYTWMHGKLYRREFLEKYRIRFSPKYSRWADDSYFNAQCTELTELTMNSLPMYVWTETAGSLTTTDRDCGRNQILTLMNAMYDACVQTLTHKTSVGHLHNTLENIRYTKSVTDKPFTDEENEAFIKLEKLYEDFGVKPDIPQKKRRGLFRR